MNIIVDALIVYAATGVIGMGIAALIAFKERDN